MHGIFNLYMIIVCPHCGLAQYIKDKQKSRKCPNSRCRKVINLEHVIVYARTYEVQKAVLIVQKIKEKQHSLQQMEDIQPVLDEGDSIR
jgi:hypothetical protein